MQEEEEGEKEYMTAREARMKSRLENENDPKYLGLIPCDVAAPENLGLAGCWPSRCVAAGARRALESH